MRIYRRSLVWVTLLLASFATSGCKKEQKKSEPAVSAPAKPKWSVDAQLEKSLRDVASTCEINADRAQVDCKDDKMRSLTREFISGKRKLIPALETFAWALEGSDEKLKVVAADLLYQAGRAGLGDDAAKGSVEPKVAQALLSVVVDKRQSSIALQVAPIAAHTSALSGGLDGFFSQLKAAPDVAPAAYRFVMVHARLDAFPQIRELANDKRSPIKLSAIEAPRNMRNWTPKDRAALCPWATGFLKEELPLIIGRAAILVSRCTGEHVDRMLDMGEAELGKHEVSRSLIPAFRDLCSGMRRRAGGGATKEQCDRNRTLLTRMVEDQKMDDQSRALALSAIAYQWPDEVTVKLARSHEKAAKAPALQKQASGTLERLTQRIESEAKVKSTGTPPLVNQLPPDQGGRQPAPSGVRPEPRSPQSTPAPSP